MKEVFTLKIKIGISLFLVLFVVPIAYASYIGLTPPQVRIDGPGHYDPREQARRFNYKPYSGVRSDNALMRETVEMQRSIKNAVNDFENSNKRYDNSVKAADETLKAFDRMIVTGF